MTTVRSVGYGGSESRPPPDVVHAIHERYLLEVVEALGLCPFARRSRETGRVHRPVFWLDADGPSAAQAATVLLERAAVEPPPEIVLLTFVDGSGRFEAPKAFDQFVGQVREAYASLDGPHYFMVGFHPELGTTTDNRRPITKDSLVPLIRRSPDPVIQCVHGPTLERVRRQAQEASHRRMLESLDDGDPVLRALLERSVHADSALSADIANANFGAVGQDDGRATLERIIADIRRARDEAYSEALVAAGT